MIALQREWLDEAFCAGENGVLGVDWHTDDEADQRWLTGWCQTCPVMAQCLEDALASESPSRVWGVRGGLTADQRVDLIRERARLARNASRRKVAA